MNQNIDFDKFYQLHQQVQPLVLANAWNVKSAIMIEKAGYTAIATSSGAIADSLGYKDGEEIPFSELLHIVKRIKSITTIPLTVDMERGYASDLHTLTDNIQRLIDLGVAGINIEDTPGEEEYLRKLTSIKNHLEKTGQKLFINARTDVFLLKMPNPLETTLHRARRYKEAGADGLFVTGVQEANIIREICLATTLPVNVVGVSTLSSIRTLAECGVRRISMAGFLYKATYTKMGDMASEILKGQSLAPLHS
jgi:2-methylisocitrate lyase-like PEP mutase family enzyme